MRGEMMGVSRRSGPSQTLTVFTLATGVLLAGYVPNLAAAETPPEIRRAERNDPAAGEVVIINRKDKAAATRDKPGPDDKTAAAPDPYAPRRPDAASKPSTRKKPAPEERRRATTPPPERGQGAASARPRASTPSGPEDRQAERERAAVALPPPPARNTKPRPARIGRARDTDARRTVERRQPDPWARRFGDDDEPARSRRRVDRGRNDALYPPPGYRPRWRDEPRYAERGPRLRDDEDLRFRRVRRPWRICRRLAWRCRDGFERACWRWRRRCR